MATTYILTTNGTDHSITYTSKAKAVETAQTYVWGAQESKRGEHHITVRTEKTGKIVFDETVSHVESDEESVNKIITSYENGADLDSVMGALGRVNSSLVSTYYDNSESAEEVVYGALTRLADMQKGESAPETLVEAQTGAEDVYDLSEINKDRAALAEWERELVANAGTLPVLPSPVLCQDCLINEATIFDMDAPSCGECEKRISALNTPAPWSCPACGAARTGDCERCGDTMPNEENDVCERELKTETVCVIQNRPGMNGMMHYHAPECRDIAREMRRHGQYEDSDVFEGAFLSAAEILSHEYGDICNNDAEDMVSEANSEAFGVRLMPCLSIPMGELNSRAISFTDREWMLADSQSEHAVPEGVEDDQTSYEVPSHTRYPNGRQGPEDTTAETEVFEPGTRVLLKLTGKWGTVVQPYMTGVIPGIGTRMSAVTMRMDNGGMQSSLIGYLMLKFECRGENGKAIHIAPCAEATGENGACCAINEDGTDLDAPEHEDAGFAAGDRVRVINVPSLPDTEGTYSHKGAHAHGVTLDNGKSILVKFGHIEMAEILVTKEYNLSVTVDEITGASVDLGWVTLTVNAAQADDHAHIAEEYGRVHGQGTPRHGWASIITVSAIADL